MFLVRPAGARGFARPTTKAFSNKRFCGSSPFAHSHVLCATPASICFMPPLVTGGPSGCKHGLTRSNAKSPCPRTSQKQLGRREPLRRRLDALRKSRAMTIPPAGRSRYGLFQRHLHMTLYGKRTDFVLELGSLRTTIATAEGGRT